MTRPEETFKEYTARRANDIARGIKSVMSGKLDIELPIEEQDNEHEAQIETLVLGFNIMCRELQRLDQLAKTELDRAKEYIELQQGTIRMLATPVIEIWDDVLVLPIVGTLDAQRSAEIMENLLRSITDHQAQHVILDITGVEEIDTKSADSLMKMARAASLLGTECVLTGLSPATAQTIVALGIDFSSISTLRTLKEGLQACLERIDESS